MLSHVPDSALGVPAVYTTVGNSCSLYGTASRYIAWINRLRPTLNSEGSSRLILNDLVERIRVVHVCGQRKPYNFVLHQELHCEALNKKPLKKSLLFDQESNNVNKIREMVRNS